MKFPKLSKTHYMIIGGIVAVGIAAYLYKQSQDKKKTTTPEATKSGIQADGAKNPTVPATETAKDKPPVTTLTGTPAIGTPNP